jgi:hypothetical protein
VKLHEIDLLRIKNQLDSLEFASGARLIHNTTPYKEFTPSSLQAPQKP